MTVKELIGHLQKIEPKDLPVMISYTQAYDCGDGYCESYSCEEDIDAVEVGFTESGKRVLFIGE